MKTIQRIIFIAWVISWMPMHAQTSLNAGDIAIVGVWGYNDASYDDSFAFVTFRNFNAGTTIYFTDKGWTESNAFYQLSPLGETIVTYTAPVNINAGTVLYFYGSKAGSSPGFSYTNNNTFSTISDQWLAYQGSEASPTFLYGLQLGNIGWITVSGTSQSTNNSWLPSTLTVGTSAITFSNSADNAVYTGGSNSNLSTLRTMIGNTANWATGTTTTRPAFPSSPLPVELTAFSLTKHGTQVQLDWTTATEANNAGFAVERCQKSPGTADNKSNNTWQNIGFVAGAGNSNTQKFYTFTDKTPPYGTVQYRLKQTDNGGTFAYHYSTEMTLLPLENRLGQNFPNPFNPETRISYHLATAGNVSIRVFNTLGCEVAVLIKGFQEAGSHEVAFHADILRLSSGMYYYQMEAGNYKEIRKMLLIK